MNLKHGRHKTPEYQAWRNMKSRCYNPNAAEFKNYGARGITICQEWLSDFPAFYRDMGDRPSEKHSLERVNNALGYSKDNCVWATDKTQSLNRRTTQMLTWNGKTQCAFDWAAEYHLEHRTFYCRLDRGLGFPALLEQPKPNLKHHSRYLRHKGLRLTCAEWSRRTGISPFTIYKRLTAGWPIARVLSPKDHRGEANRKRHIT